MQSERYLWKKPCSKSPKANGLLWKPTLFVERLSWCLILCHRLGMCCVLCYRFYHVNWLFSSQIFCQTNQVYICYICLIGVPNKNIQCSDLETETSLNCIQAIILIDFKSPHCMFILWCCVQFKHRCVHTETLDSISAVSISRLSVSKCPGDWPQHGEQLPRVKWVAVTFSSPALRHPAPRPAPPRPDQTCYGQCASY